MQYVRHVATIAAKDLRVELRSRELVYSMVFFAAMVVLVFSFAFVEEGKAVGDVSSGILWIAVLFSGTLGLSRGFEREREGDTMRALLLAPIPRSAIFVGKAIGVVVFMLVVQAIVVPAVAFLFGEQLFAYPLALVLTLLLATIGIAVPGAVFATILLRSRSRQVLLPIILYPLLVPLMIAATKSTAAIAAAQPDVAIAYFWIKFLVVFDAAFILVALWFFEPLVIE